MAQAASFIVGGFGNTTVRLARATSTADGIPNIYDVLVLPAHDPDWSRIATWLANDGHGSDALTWYTASVFRATEDSLMDWLVKRFSDISVKQLTSRDFPIEIQVEFPERVGADRIAAALAAGRLRTPGHAAVVVDAGTAINIDGVNKTGAFVGGAILCGWNTSARALARQTDLLPDIASQGVDRQPLALGTSTEKAIHSGLYWGSIGAVKEIVAQIARQLGSHQHDLFVTGGDGREIARHLGRHANYVSELVLTGVALAADCRPEQLAH